MRTFTGSYIAHGDVNIFVCDDIPENLPAAPLHNGCPIVGHSETGHMHVIEGNAVRVYEQDEFMSYLDVQETAKIVHLRGFDTHEAIEIPPGQYRVTRQREYVADGFRRAAD